MRQPRHFNVAIHMTLYVRQPFGAHFAYHEPSGMMRYTGHSFNSNLESAAGRNAGRGGTPVCLHAMLARLDQQLATPGVSAGHSAMNTAYLKICADSRGDKFHQLGFAEPLSEEQVALLEAPSNHEAEYEGALQDSGAPSGC